VNDIPETKYVRVGDRHVAYQVLGDGPPDLLLVRSNINHLELQWEEPNLAAFMRGLAAFGRVIMYDDRGAGMSDPVTERVQLLVEDRNEDPLAVLDATGAGEVVVIGAGAGGMRACFFTASHPERAIALVLCESRAANVMYPEYEFGLTEEEGRRYRDPRFRVDLLGMPEEHAAWWDRYWRLSTSRGFRSALFRDPNKADVRPILGSIHVSTLVIEHTGSFKPGRGRDLAQRISGARFVELPGKAVDRKSTRLNSSHPPESRMPSSA